MLFMTCNLRCQELGLKNPILLPHLLMDALAKIASDTNNQDLMFTPFTNLLRTAVEAVVSTPCIAIALRPKAGSWAYVIFHCDELTADEMSASRYLALKERLVDGK